MKCPKPYEVTRPIQVEQNRRQTAFLSNSSSGLHTSCLRLVQLYFNILIYVTFVDYFSFAPIDTSLLYDLH